jgi:hypothetical protein
LLPKKKFVAINKILTFVAYNHIMDSIRITYMGVIMNIICKTAGTYGTVFCLYLSVLSVSKAATTQTNVEHVAVTAGSENGYGETMTGVNAGANDAGRAADANPASGSAQRESTEQERIELVVREFRKGIDELKKCAVVASTAGTIPMKALVRIVSAYVKRIEDAGISVVRNPDGSSILATASSPGQRGAVGGSSDVAEASAIPQAQADWTSAAEMAME